MREWREAVQRMIDWIEDNLTEQPSLLDMSRQIGYSPYYCSTQFHAIAGMTLRSYLAGRRLCRAALEIRDTNERILDIAIKYGYGSQEALTRAFTAAFGCTPNAYRKHPRPLPLPVKRTVLHPEYDQAEGGLSMAIMKPHVRVEYIPAHKYIGIFDPVARNYGEMWERHDCDRTTGIIDSMGHVAHPIVTGHTAGWTWKDGSRTYFYGIGVSADYEGEIPEGFEVREVPASYYLVFAHPPFDYVKENVEVMRLVEELAWQFDPAEMGYRWNELQCPDYQRHYPEGLGYQVLRPVVKL